MDLVTNGMEFIISISVVASACPALSRARGASVRGGARERGREGGEEKKGRVLACDPRFSFRLPVETLNVKRNVANGGRLTEFPIAVAPDAYTRTADISFPYVLDYVDVFFFLRYVSSRLTSPRDFAFVGREQTRGSPDRRKMARTKRDTFSRSSSIVVRYFLLYAS